MTLALPVREKVFIGGDWKHLGLRQWAKEGFKR